MLRFASTLAVALRGTSARLGPAVGGISGMSHPFSSASSNDDDDESEKSSAPALTREEVLARQRERVVRARQLKALRVEWAQEIAQEAAAQVSDADAAAAAAAQLAKEKARAAYARKQAHESRVAASKSQAAERISKKHEAVAKLVAHHEKAAASKRKGRLARKLEPQVDTWLSPNSVEGMTETDLVEAIGAMDEFVSFNQAFDYQAANRQARSRRIASLVKQGKISDASEYGQNRGSKQGGQAGGAGGARHRTKQYQQRRW